MTPPKYARGKQIKTIQQFENSLCTYFRVKFGDREKTVHRSFLISWQYRTLKQFIHRGQIYETKGLKDETPH